MPLQLGDRQRMSGEARDKRTDKPQQAARLAAMNLLARREHSFFELFEKLAQKFPDFDPDQDIRPALERLREQGLQSDARFVENFIRYRASRGVGPLKIRAELYPKRLDEALLEQSLREAEVDWFSLCEAAWQRRFRPSCRPDLKQKQQITRFLSQRGFTSEQLAHVLDLAAELPPEPAPD